MDLETVEVCGACLSEDHRHCTTSIKWVDPDKSVRGAVCQCHALNHGKLRPWQLNLTCSVQTGVGGAALCNNPLPCKDHPAAPSAEVVGMIDDSMDRVPPTKLFLPGEGD